MKSRRATVLLFTLLVVTPFASAQAAVAILEHLAGSPRIFEVGASGARTVSLPERGAEYRLPIEIETGPDDSATFRLPDSNVSVAPNSVMRLAAPQAKDGGLLQRIFQKAGAALFSVDRQTVEHFQVDTPYLVSVVKGTTFNVVVHDEGATVSLHEGLLQVTSVDNSQRVMLRPGDVAFSGKDGELRKLEHVIAQRERAANDLGTSAQGDMEPMEAPDLNDVIALQEALTGDIGADLDERLGGIDPGLDDVIDDLGQRGGDVVDDLGSDIDPLIDPGDAGDLLGDIGDSAGDLLGDIGDSADQLLLGDVGGSVDQLTGDLGGDVGQIADDVTAPVGDLTGQLGSDLTGDLTGDLGDAAADVTGDLGDLTGDLGATDGLTGDLGGTGGGLGGLLGGGLQL